jgi:hypothetical protein
MQKSLSRQPRALQIACIVRSRNASGVSLIKDHTAGRDRFSPCSINNACKSTGRNKFLRVYNSLWRLQIKLICVSPDSLLRGHYTAHDSLGGCSERVLPRTVITVERTQASVPHIRRNLEDRVGPFIEVTRRKRTTGIMPPKGCGNFEACVSRLFNDRFQRITHRAIRNSVSLFSEKQGRTCPGAQLKTKPRPV